MNKLFNIYLSKKRLSVIISVLLITLVFVLSSCITDKVYKKIPEKKKAEVSVLNSYREGDILYCRMGTGSVDFGGEWQEFKDKDFVVIKNSRSNVNISNVKGTENQSMQAIFDEKGQKIILCPLTADDSKETVECLNLYFLDKDLELGIKRSVNINRFIRGAAITCAYDEVNLKSLPPPK